MNFKIETLEAAFDPYPLCDKMWFGRHKYYVWKDGMFFWYVCVNVWSGIYYS